MGTRSLTRFVIITCLIISLFPHSVSSQTYISGGNVYGTWDTAGSPYYVMDNVTIPDDSALIIDPGVSILFYESVDLIVEGTLLAVGTETDSIIFSSLSPTQKWHSIIFEDDYSGSMNDNDSSKIIHCIIENTFHEIGYFEEASIYVDGFSKLLISNNTIKNNTYGLSISLDCYPILSNNIITNNEVGICCYGGEPFITNNIISFNTNKGIRLYYYDNYGNQRRIISNNKICNNEGGGIYMLFSNPYLINNVISNNSGENGGGIFCDSHVIFTNNIITNNYASQEGGGIYIAGESSNLNTMFYNNVIFGNIANEGDQIYINPGQLETEFYHNNIEGGIAGFGLTPGTVFQGEYVSCFESDPKFVNPSQGAGHLFNGLEADWSLEETSPCINTGTPDTNGLYIPEYDLAGNPRIYNNTFIDVGGYEYQGFSNLKLINVDPANELLMINISGGIEYFDVRIKNVGDLSLQIDSITTTTEICQLDSNYFGSMVQPLDSLFIPVIFDCNILGTFFDTLNIWTNADNGILYRLPLRGKYIPDGDSIHVAGIISENTTWSAKVVLVNDHVTVNNGVTLSISLGTFIEFQDKYYLHINGKIHSIGEYGDTIVYTAQYKNIGWGSLRIQNASVLDTSIIKYSKLEHGRSSLYSNGGAIYTYGNLEVRNCLFKDNNALHSFGDGGAIYNGGSNIYIKDCVFKNNKGYMGGAVCGFGNGNKNYIINNVFIGNMSSSNGGAICAYSSNSQSYIINNLFVSNISESRGGAINVHNNNIKIVNNTFVNNSANAGGGISSHTTGNSYTHNCIFWNNEANSGDQIWIDMNNIANLFNCLVQDSIAGIGGTGQIGYLSHILDTDPMFLSSGENPYSLSDTSPCIDAGWLADWVVYPDFDVINNSRFFDGNGDGSSDIDIGAYEFYITSFASSINDINRNNRIGEFNAFPNPFSKSITINYNVLYDSDVEINIYDSFGQKICIIEDKFHSNGKYQTTWNGRDTKGYKVNQGIYFVRLKSNSEDTFKKVIYIPK